MTTPKSDDWHRLNRAVRAACNERGVDEDDRKALVLRVTGKASLGDCAPDEVRAVLEWVKGGRGQAHKRYRANNLSDHPTVAARQKKILALWLVLYDLAIMEDNSDAALNAFIRRHSRVDTLRWLNVRQADRMIDRLKAMIGDRVTLSWDCWKDYHPARAVIDVQFVLLARAGIWSERMSYSLAEMAAEVTKKPSFESYAPKDYQAVQKDWGRRLRRLKRQGKLAYG